MNNFKVFIDKERTGQKSKFVDYTPFAVFPPKFANFLDEQLDEANITLKQIKDEVFEPFTRVTITLQTANPALLTESMASAITPENSGVSKTIKGEKGKTITEEWTIDMFVANDKSVETPAGSGRYNHEIYLIEATKLLERNILESITFTNALGNNYKGNVKSNCVYHKVTIMGGGGAPEWNGTFSSSFYPAFFQSGEITIPSNDEVLANEKNNTGDATFPENMSQNQFNGVFSSNGTKVSDTPTFFAQVGQTYTAKYRYGGQVALNVTTLDLTYTFSIVDNKLPLKKWTVTDVVNRIFDLVEPLRKDLNHPNTSQDTPAFRLDGVTFNYYGQRNPTNTYTGQAQKYEEILAPEFAFSKMTLREALQQVGGFIHAEPRIAEIQEELDDKGEFIRNIYIVKFDEYGSLDRSNIKEQKYLTATLSTNINQYCTSIDSTADNVVDTLNWADGVIIDPYNSGYIAMRSDTTTVRLQENNNTVIPTAFPIYKVGEKKVVVCKYIPVLPNGEQYGNWDITPYIYEKSDYDLLSSINDVFPYSKAYALYYTQGEKNIRGLFYKAPSEISSVLKKYAIVNILEKVTGKTLNFSQSEQGKTIYDCAFQIQYLPLFKTRVGQHKQRFSRAKGANRSVLSYAQGANMIETRYYGNHLLGTVERLGNVEKTYTYNLPYLSYIPKIGTLFDDNYYISNVSFEFLPMSIKCTVMLSKNFNRLSQYIGINSNKRMWEVSERQVQERQSIYTSYVVISSFQPDGNKTGFCKYLFNANNTWKYYSQMVIRRYTAKGQEIQPDLTLPLISSVFGKTMTFTAEMQDNYAAGEKLVWTNDEGIKGYWGQYIPYNDYYGRFYYLNYGLYSGKEPTSINPAVTLPEGNMQPGIYPIYSIVYRKDNREKAQITIAQEAVTDDEDIVIGDGVFKYCSLVNATYDTIQYPVNEMYRWFSLFVSKEKITGIGNNIPLNNRNIDELTAEMVANPNFIQFPFVNISDEYQSWFILKKGVIDTINVEDEFGNITTQEIQEGGEMIFGSNNMDLLKNADETKRRVYIYEANKIENI